MASKLEINADVLSYRDTSNECCSWELGFIPLNVYSFTAADIGKALGGWMAGPRQTCATSLA